HKIRAHQLDGLRCGSMLREPGGLKEPVVHVWTHRGKRIVPPIKPTELLCDDAEAPVFRSYFPQDQLPADPTGPWACATYTVGGQLVGLRRFHVLGADGEVAPAPAPKPETPAPPAGDAGVAGAP